MRSLAPLPAALLVCAALGTSSAPAAARLPDGVKPSRYAISLAIDLDTATFTGSETIDVELVRPTDKITLHALDLTIDEARAGGAGSAAASPAASVAPTPGNKAGDTVTLTLVKALPAGKARLALRFHGKLDERLRGLYLARLAGKRYALTQFEGTDARRAFPCFDEPSYKARFQLTLQVGHGMAAVSNTPIVKRTTSADGKKDTVEFAETLPMSTYLVAMAVGPLASKSIVGGQSGKVPITVWAPAGDEKLADYALRETAAVLPRMEAWFGIPYPYGKLDLIAAPEFQFGGMENVACILFKMSALLLDEKVASPATRRRVSEVIAHEVAHQWFGDLVTMAWWDDIWLNESFATWMEKKIIDELHPEWHIWRDYVGDRAGTLETDELGSTHPIRSPIFTDDEDEQHRSPTIIYGKGSAVLRMVERWLGEERFRGGVRAYMEKHKFGNTRGADFFGALAEASGQPVGGMAEQWIQQTGHPLVTVSAECRKGAGAAGKGETRLTFEQERLFGDGRGHADTLWQVPVCTRFAASPGDDKGREICVMLKDRRQSVDLAAEGGGCLPWVVANSGAAGFFRVRYDAGLFTSLLKVAPRVLRAEERVALLDDQWALVAAGRVPLAAWFDVLAALRGERDRAVLDAMARAARVMDRHLATDSERPALGRLVESIFGPHLRQLGLSARAGDDEDTRRLRALAAEQLGMVARDAELASKARETLGAFFQQGTPLDGATADTFIAIAAQQGDAALYDRYLARVKEDRTPEERERFLEGLGRFERPELVQRTLDLSMGELLRTEEMDRPLRMALGSRAGRADGMRFLAAHLADVQKRASLWGNIRLVMAAGGLCSDEEAKSVKELFDAHPVKHGQLAVSMAMDAIRVCVARREQARGKLGALLQAAAPRAAH